MQPKCQIKPLAYISHESIIHLKYISAQSSKAKDKSFLPLPSSQEIDPGVDLPVWFGIGSSSNQVNQSYQVLTEGRPLEAVTWPLTINADSLPLLQASASPA